MMESDKQQLATPFSRIPAEIWEKIILQANLLPETLFKLALMSRRLYNICVYGYLYSQGHRDIEEEVRLVVGCGRLPRYDAIAALRLPFGDIGGTKKFDCTILGRPGAYRDNDDVDTLLYHLSRLCKAIQSFSYIKQVVIRFEDFGIARTNSEEASLKGAARSIGLLLDILLAEKKCEALEIHGLDYFGSLFYHYKPQPRWQITPTIATSIRALGGRSRGISDLVKGENWHFHRSPSQIGSKEDFLVVPTDEALHNTKLQHISLRSESFYSPPLLHWAYCVLQASPIQSIDILIVDRWSLVSTLFARALPGLKSLRIDHTLEMKPNHFISWLETAFPQLTTLSLIDTPHCEFSEDVSRNNIHRDWRRLPPTSLPSLSQLEDLVISANWLNLLFGDDRHLKLFPKLRRLTVVFDEYCYPPTNSSATRAALAKLSGLRKEGKMRCTMTCKVVGDKLLASLVGHGVGHRYGQQFPEITSVYGVIHDNLIPSTEQIVACFSRVILQEKHPISSGRNLFVKTVRDAGRWLEPFAEIDSLVLNGTVSNWTGANNAADVDHLLLCSDISKLKHLEVDGVDRSEYLRFLQASRS